MLVDTTVQEKAITYPTDSKLRIKIINRLNKLAKAEGIQQRRSFVKETKSLRLACRHFHHVKWRYKAKNALKELRTIAEVLMRELRYCTLKGDFHDLLAVVFFQGRLPRVLNRMIL